MSRYPKRPFAILSIEPLNLFFCLISKNIDKRIFGHFRRTSWSHPPATLSVYSVPFHLPGSTYSFSNTIFKFRSPPSCLSLGPIRLLFANFV